MHHILTESKISFMLIFVNFNFTLWLISEGYVWQGIAFLWFMLILSSMSFFYARNKVLNDACDVKAQNINYSSYLRKCIFSSIEARANIITDQSFLMIICRIALCATVVLFCLYSIVFSAFSYFPYMLFNKLMYLCIIVFAVIYLVAGLRFCAFPAFVCFCLIMGTYFLQNLYYGFNTSAVMYNVVFYLNISFAFAIGYRILLYFIKRNYIYSDLQSFEHFGNYQIADLYLKEFAPIQDYEVLLKYKIPLGEISECEIFNFIHSAVAICRTYKAIFAGVIVNKNTNSVELYCYMNKNAVEDIDNFSRLFIEYTHKVLSVNANCKKMCDSKWLAYNNLLFPLSTELCAIISRNHIEELFVNGKTFDKDYELSFYVYFKEKKHLIAFEDILELHGFELVNASFTGEDIKKIDGYPYCGEYKTTTYISVRRLECLNKTILDESEKFGCYYIGDWKVND